MNESQFCSLVTTSVLEPNEWVIKQSQSCPLGVSTSGRFGYMGYTDALTHGHNKKQHKNFVIRSYCFPDISL